MNEFIILANGIKISAKVASQLPELFAYLKNFEYENKNPVKATYDKQGVSRQAIQDPRSKAI